MIVDALARSVVACGARVDRDVGLAGRERPADLLVHGFGPRGEAIDVTVSHSVAVFDSPGSLDRLARVAISKHGHYDVSCRQAKVGFRVFGLSSFGSAAPEAMSIISDLRAQFCERFGKREGRVLAQQAVEKIAVACMKGVGAELVQDFAAVHAPEEPMVLYPSSPEVDGGIEDRGYRQWREWARVHGFEPQPPTGIFDSTGIRFITRGSHPVGDHAVSLVGDGGPPAVPAERVLVWASEDLAERVWAWRDPQ